MPLIYTNIQHRFRKINKLSCNEYVIADMIYQLSVSPEAKIKGWCYMSRVKMADEMGLTKQSILNIIDSLIQKGFVEKDAETSFLKTTRPWNIVYFTDGKESLPTEKKVFDSGKESLPNNNINNTSLFNNKEVHSSDKKPKRENKKFVPPSIDDVKLYFKENGYTPESANTAFKYYTEADWHDAIGKPVKNWKQKMISVWFKKENQIPVMGTNNSQPQQKISL